jgi:purine-binding chemotaxis protein CheW
MDAETVAAAEAERAVAPLPEWLVVWCAGASFAVPLAAVREIVTPHPFTRLPGCGRHVCGLAGVRGRMITVIDLGVLLGGRAARAHPDHRLLVIDGGQHGYGAVVERTAFATAMPLDTGASALQDLLTGVPALTDADVFGTGMVNDERVLALDVSRLIGRHIR